jgi:hypothetical protein
LKLALLLLIFCSSVLSVNALESPEVQIQTFSDGDSINVVLTWSGVLDATGYIIYELSEPYGERALLAQVAGNQFSHSFSTTGSRFFQVVAENIAADPPTEPAPTPIHPEADVVSLFSDAYPDIIVDSWSADWDQADVEDIQIAGDDVKLYTDLIVAGIEIQAPFVDGLELTHLHLDIWTAESTTFPAQFKIELVDYGTDCYWDIDNVEHELIFDAYSNPPLQTGSWISFDIQLNEFTDLITTRHLAELIISGDLSRIYLDNLYFYAGVVIDPNIPAVPAPTPDQDPGDVISLFSNSYNDVTVNSWSADWDQANVADVQIAGDDVKLYTDLNYAGIEFTSPTIDASAMTHFRMDIWTADPTDLPDLFWVRLVDFGANGVWDGGGDDVEATVNIDATYDPPLQTGVWISLDIPMTEFEQLVTRDHLAQLLIGGDPNRVYLDNVYLYDDGSIIDPNLPSEPAPVPAYNSGDVISLFSDSYTDVPVATWSASWDNADVMDDQIDGDAVKLYTNLGFAGIEFVTPTVDASEMTHFRLDFWTADPTDPPAVFKIKLVDFGADGLYGGGDDLEHELTFDAMSEPPLQHHTWVSFDISLNAFTTLVSVEHLAQLIISGDPDTVYLDNVLFHR